MHEKTEKKVHLFHSQPFTKLGLVEKKKTVKESRQCMNLRTTVTRAILSSIHFFLHATFILSREKKERKNNEKTVHLNVFGIGCT